MRVGTEIKQFPPKPEKEPIIGWRGWKLDDEGYLRSLSHSYFVWPKREAADCGGVPGMEGEDIYPYHGIYAYKQRNHFMEGLLDFHVVGEVYLWGQVIEHEDGYRAQYAYPKSFQVRPGFDPFQIGPVFDIIKIMQLEEDYGVPATFANDLKPKPLPLPRWTLPIKAAVSDDGTTLTIPSPIYTMPDGMIVVIPYGAKEITIQGDGTVLWVEPQEVPIGTNGWEYEPSGGRETERWRD